MLALGLHAWPDQLDHLLHDLAHVDRPPVDLHVVGLDAGHVEQVVDQLDQPVGRLQDDLDELALAIGHVVRGALEQLDEPLDRGEGAAQLVRGGGHELALGPLQTRTLAHVVHGPHHARALVAEAGRGNRQRASAVVDHLLPGERLVL